MATQTKNYEEKDDVNILYGKAILKLHSLLPSTEECGRSYVCPAPEP